MQKLLLILITLILSFLSPGLVVKAKEISSKAEKIETKTITLNRFAHIRSEMIFDVEIIKSNEEKAEIKSNYLAYVEVNVKNNVLEIGYKKGHSLNNVSTKVIIYAKDVKTISASTGSVVKIKNNFGIEKFSTESGGKIFGDSNAKNVTIATQSGGSFLGTINTENLVLNAESGSSIDVQGKINSAKITSEGASQIIATKTNISVANVNAESASSVTLSVSKELTASASSMAKIRYKTLSGIKFSAKRDSGGTIDSF